MDEAPNATSTVFNSRAIATNGDKIMSLLDKWTMPKREALVMAAWIVALADDDEEFPKVLEAVQST